MATRSLTAIEAAVQRIQQVNINFLAIDFDQTFIDIHTGGVWQGTLEELKEHVRPEFRDLVAAAMQTGTIHIAIVTFSAQPALIKNVLEGVLGLELAERIPVRGGDRSWKYEGVGSKDGKQAHMASAVEELEQSGDVEISKSTTLLIDDDKRNIRIAMENGVRAVWFCPNGMVEVGLNYQMIGCGKDSVKASLLRGVSTLVKDTTKLYVEKEANQFH